MRDIQSPALAHGRKYESVAVQKFEQEYQVKTTECGLFVSVVNPFLAATPDRVLDENTILEVKCPYSARDRDVTPASVPYLKHSDDGALYLDPQHSYYYQVQGQLYYSNRRLCYFVVYSRKSMRVVTISSLLTTWLHSFRIFIPTFSRLLSQWLKGSLQGLLFLFFQVQININVQTVLFSKIHVLMHGAVQYRAWSYTAGSTLW